jgi:hypothetical protein
MLVGLKSRGKAVRTTHLWRGKRMYSSYSFTTSAVDGVRGQRHAPDALYTRYPLYRRLDGPEPIWTHRLEEKSYCLCRGSNLDRLVVQSVVRHYTGWATPAAGLKSKKVNIQKYVRLHRESRGQLRPVLVQTWHLLGENFPPSKQFTPDENRSGYLSITIQDR